MRISRELERTTASAIKTCTYPTISKYSCPHLPANFKAKCLSACRVSWPDIPSTEYTSGVKFLRLRCSRRTLRCLSFFCCSCLRTLIGSWFHVDPHSSVSDSVSDQWSKHQRCIDVKNSPFPQNLLTAISSRFLFATAYSELVGSACPSSAVAFSSSPSPAFWAAPVKGQS